VDPQFKGFGADRHRYWLGLTLSVGELARLERNRETRCRLLPRVHRDRR
jgi:hypothetical protein